MSTKRPHTALDAVIGRSLADANWVTGRALQDVIGGFAVDRMFGVQKVLAGLDVSTMFPTISRIDRILASLSGPAIIFPALLRFDELTRQLNRTLLPVMPDLANINALAAESQRRLLETVGSSLRPLSIGIGNVLSPELLDSLRLLSEQLASVQDNPVAAEAALDRAAQATPSLRPLIEWLRENNALATWAGIVFMLIFFITEQVQRDPNQELQLPPGAVLIVPPECESETATVTVEVSAR